MEQPIFQNNSTIGRARIDGWLDRCGGHSEGTPIVLPMLQRGSVWKPNQLLDLWDSLLRGFPVGCFMLDPIKKGKWVRQTTASQSEELKEDALGLLDGQQRTLAMLVGWPRKREEMDRRIWIDFADEPASEHLFRYRVTTENHPFGFQLQEPNARLSVSDRQKARRIYEHAARYIEDEHEIARLEAGKFPDFRKSRPYSAKPSLSVDLGDLIKLYRQHLSLDDWMQNLEQRLKAIQNWQERKGEGDKWEIVATPQEEIDRLLSLPELQTRMNSLHAALGRMLALEFPLVKVNSGQVHADDTDEKGDPALAILFKRVGSNATLLTNEDYIYSVIKHHCPQAHDLVEQLRNPGEGLRDYNLAGLLSSTSIVVTAVRLAAARCRDEKGQDFPDQEVLDKKNFAKLLRSPVQVDGLSGTTTFMASALLPLIEGGKLAQLFAHLGEALQYEKGIFEVGLPKQALWLLDRPLIQVLLYWLMKKGGDRACDAKERADLIRFVLFWNLCVTDAAKASRMAFTLLGGAERSLKEVHDKLLAEHVAMDMYAPEVLEKMVPDAIKATVEDSEHPLKGWKRFFVQDEKDEQREARKFYGRFWKSNGNSGRYQHPLLLWLQRDYVNSAFNSSSPVAGREEDTPFDYDHILPASHWSGWAGIRSNDRLLDFLADQTGDKDYWLTGNSIGNVRVWESSRNRSDGDVSPSQKIGGDKTAMAHSAMEPDQWGSWEACSAPDEQKKGHWNVARTVAFQQAVEDRVFSLYSKLYIEAGFAQWKKVQGTSS